MFDRMIICLSLQGHSNNLTETRENFHFCFAACCGIYYMVPLCGEKKWGLSHKLHRLKINKSPLFWLDSLQVISKTLQTLMLKRHKIHPFPCPHKGGDWEWHCQKISLIITTTWWRRSAHSHLSRDDSRGSAEEHKFYEPGWYFYTDATWHAVHSEGLPRTIKLSGYSCNLPFLHAAISANMSYALSCEHEDKPVCHCRWIMSHFGRIIRN